MYIEKILNRLERRFGRYAVPQVTLGLIMLQVVVYVLTFARPEIQAGLYLIPDLVMAGQVWRLITFLAVPPVTNPVFAFFFWYFFFLMGNALDSFWGTFRYNIYLLIGYLATVAVSFSVPNAPSSNAFLQASVFLAFAFLNPDFLIYLFFIIPIRIKWLALFTWIMYGFILITGPWISKFLVIASIFNYLVFFGADIRDRIKTGRRQMAFQANRFAGSRTADEPFHRCVVCGITDKTHPDMDFRYCLECAAGSGYCTEHIFNHPHVIPQPQQ
jgi:hypothetical protein